MDLNLHEYQDVLQKVIMYHSPIVEPDKVEDYIQTSVSEEICPDEVEKIEQIVEEFCDFFNKKDYRIKVYPRKTHGVNSTCDKYFYERKYYTTHNKELVFCSGVVKFADIAVSGNINPEEYINFSFEPTKLNFNKPVFYNGERWSAQCLDAERINERRICAFSAPTGYGKTLIGLKWMLSDNKKCIWVCPTNLIAYGVYSSIKMELDNIGLGDTIKVGLLLSNKFEYGEENGTKNDIIITNIDNYTRPIFKSDEKKHMAFNFNYCNVVFDEYHKYIGESAMLAIFEIALWSRTLSPVTKTLLMSATGNDMFYRHIKNEIYFHEVQSDSEMVEKFCNKRFHIDFSRATETDDKDDTLFVRNSVSSCQKLFDRVHKDNEKALCFHSHFTKDDRKEKFDTILEHHGKNGDKDMSVCSTNIFTTGIDVSFRKLVVGVAPFDEIIQTSGRLNRWSEYDENTVTLSIDESDMKTPGEVGAVIAKYDFDLNKREFEFLRRNLDKDFISLGDLYTIRTKMMSDESYRKRYEDIFNRWEKKSFEALSKLTYKYVSKPFMVEEEFISDSPNIRTKDSKHDTVKLYIWAEGMKDGEYMEAEISESILDDAKSLDYISRKFSNAVLAEKYFDKNYKHVQKKLKEAKNVKFEKWRKISKDYQKLAKRCSKPFLISPVFYKYNSVKGLYSTK